MNKDTLVLHLFAECILVKGYLRSVIYDIKRNDYHFIPNELYFFIEANHGKPKPQIIQMVREDETLKEYITFLEEHEIIVWLEYEYHNRLPPINTLWDSPFLFSSAIIDIDVNSNHEYGLIANKLDEINCKSILLRSFISISLSNWHSILDKFRHTGVRQIEIISKFSDEYNDLNAIKDLISTNDRIKSLILHSSDKENIAFYGESGFGLVSFLSQELNSPEDCFNLSPEYLTVNISQYIEAQSRNTFYNEKIYINNEGEIKRCSSEIKTYGHINDTELYTLTHNADFNKLSKITKDKTLICKDCEHRYMCNYSYALQEHDNGLFYNKKECSYNPYIGKWEGQPGYKKLENTGVSLNQKNITFDENLINKLNLELWTEP